MKLGAVATGVLALVTLGEASVQLNEVLKLCGDDLKNCQSLGLPGSLESICRPSYLKCLSPNNECGCRDEFSPCTATSQTRWGCNSEMGQCVLDCRAGGKAMPTHKWPSRNFNATMTALMSDASITCTTRTAQRTIGFPTGGYTVWPAFAETDCYEIHASTEAPMSTSASSPTSTGAQSSSLATTLSQGRLKGTAPDLSIPAVLLPGIMLAGAAAFL